MTKNTYGRHKICITRENVEKFTGGDTALSILNDYEQYEFESLDTLKLCCEKANVNLLSFEEACGRAPHHGYEVEEFYQNQVDGTTHRFYQPNADEDAISKAVSGQHYNDVVPGFQYMEMMQYMLEDKAGVEAHLLGQVYKYLMRAGKKDDVEQEYRKARWYLNCLVKYKQTGKIDCSEND